MKVSLVSHTHNARELLIFTKNTRLNMSASMENIWQMPPQEKQAELAYMINTIKSSWEFVDFTFMIEDVTRAFTHQFVRNRQGSYAQQTMRLLDKKDFTYSTGPSIITDDQKSVYDYCMNEIQYCYDRLIAEGVSIEDARGVLPTNINTNIVAKFNLRTLSDMMASRASSRTQSEYRDVIELMYEVMVEAEPWVAEFLRNPVHYALKEIELALMHPSTANGKLVDNIKLIDLIRNAK